MKKVSALSIHFVAVILFFLFCNAGFAQGIWETKQLGTEVVWHDIFFIDPDNGWICGENRSISRTTDGGETWVPVSPEVGNTIYSVFFVTMEKGWAITDAGHILYSEDGGTTWTIQDTKPTYLLDIQFLDENKGWIFAGEGHIYHTTDGGNNWTEQSTGQWADFYNGLMIDSLNGIAVGYSGFIVYTTNGGQTWTRASSGTGNTLFGVSFADENTGWASGEEILLKTTDGGKTWSKQKDFADESLRDVYFKNSTEGWLVSYYIPGQDITKDGKIYYTSDGGENWVIQENSSYTIGFNAISYLDDQNIWIASDHGVLAKMISQPTFSAETILPDQFKLHQNFPNPFSQTTTIGFDLEEKSHVRMALFDISGGKILELINAEYLPGTHEKVFDARELTGGLYYYTIWVNGNMQTKKLIANK